MERVNNPDLKTAVAEPLPSRAKEYLKKIAMQAAQEAPSGLEKSRAVDAVMGVLINWRHIETDLQDIKTPGNN